MARGLAKRLVETALLVGLMALVGCAGLGTPVTVKAPEAGKRVVQMKASNFKFEPNNIRVPETGPLTLEVENISGTVHNITIKNPKGQVLKSADLPPKETVSVTVELSEPGKYEFICDKPAHPTLGMVGEIQVGS